MPRSRSQSLSRSPPRRQERSLERSHQKHRDDHRDRKRARSRSREQPRKRRSTTPEKRPARRRSTSADYRNDRHKRERRDRNSETGDRDHHRSRPRSRSPRRHSPQPLQRSNRPLPSQNDAFRDGEDGASPGPVVEKQKPNFRPSGLLAAASNTVTTSSGSIVLKYHEPAESRKPPSSRLWRLYIFKDDEIIETLELYTQSCWLFGREISVCDYALEHPSCSKQHGVIQFRYIEKRNEFGDKIGKVKPYVIDLESGNGTKVNDEAMPAGRYVELRDKDVIKFGHSTREYVVQLPPA